MESGPQPVNLPESGQGNSRRVSGGWTDSDLKVNNRTPKSQPTQARRQSIYRSVKIIRLLMVTWCNHNA